MKKIAIALCLVLLVSLSNLIKDPWGDEKATIQNLFILADYRF